MEKMDIPASNHHVGSTERAFVAHVNDLNDFYLHSASVRESLVKLGQDLYDEYCESLKTPLGLNETLNVGDFCACPSESEDWYRGLIRQLDANGHAIVFKIDYGDVQCIPIQFLRPLQKRFFQLHRLAFHCSLVNLIKPINGWSLDIIEEFRSRLTTTFLYARFINYNEIRDISEVEITEKSSKTPLNKDFEQYQIQRSTLEMNDKLVYKYIPMEILDSTQPNHIRILYYISPSCFYVYLREKMNSHTSFQIDLQEAIQHIHPISSPKKYQPIAAQDNHAVWHRAIILDVDYDTTKICVYFIDIGQREYIPINNIRPLPEEFQRKPTFAIPCRLYNVFPLNGNTQSIWNSDDQVHDEFNRLMVNNVTCQVRSKQDQLYYDVEIDIPKIGDLGTFLYDNNLISRTTMRPSLRPGISSGQPPQQSFIRAQLNSSGTPPRQQQSRFIQSNEYYNNSNNMTQQQQQQTTRILNTGLQSSTIQQPPNIPTTNSSSSIPVVPPENGYYTITQVRSAAEFYGLSQNRESEFNGLSKYLADYYNKASNDSSLSVTFIMNGILSVIQEGDKYHRVMIKNRPSESRVSVKLVDRGDEIFVDISELLQIDNKAASIPAFAQPFRLHGYEESQSSASITFNLKKLILNQRVQISQCGPMINGFYPVEVTLNGNQSVNKMLLSNDKNLSITSSTSTNRPSFNQPPPTHIESLVFSNSSRHHSTISHDLSGRYDVGQRTNDALPPPQKILTGPPRIQPARFGATSNQTPSSNEQISRFSNVTNRNQQQQQSQTVDSSSSNSVWNKDQNTKPNFPGNNPANPQTFGRQQSGSSQFGTNQRTDDNKTSITNNQNRFPSNTSDNQQSSFEQKRSFGSGYDDRNERQTSGSNFQQNNHGTNESGLRRGGFSNRGSTDGFSDRGGRGGFNDRNVGRNNEENNENSSQISRGFSRGTGGFGDRGGRGGNFQDRNGANRNQGDDYNENNMQRSQNFSNSRGGFQGGRDGGYQNRRDQGENGDFGRRGGLGGGYQNRRDQGENGDFGRRGGRGGSRGGGFNSGRDGFRDRDNMGLKLTSDNNNPSRSFSGWPNTRSTSTNFEAGDRFIESEIPKDTFKFVVSHIETANDFFIQLLSKGDEIKSLSDTLQNEYKQSPELNLNSFKINQPCLAKSSDGCWYRAIVLSTGLSKLKVRFIDFGDPADVDSNTIRQIAKKHCSPAPYAYRCTFKNAQVVENVNRETVIDKCYGKDFNGKIQMKTSDGKFILESDDFLNILLEINAIKLKSEVTFKRIKCLVGYVEPEQQELYIQDDEETLNKIADLIQNEEPNTPTLSLDEIKQLEPKTLIIAIFEDAPYRGIITQYNESDEDLNICFIDYGNTSSCPKISLKRCSEQLSSYPYQAKHCHLYGISSNEIINALKYLGDNTDPDNTLEISIINEKDQIYNVLVYINNQCINEKFGYDPNSITNNDQSSTTTETIVKEEEQQQTNDEVLSTNEISLDTSTVIKSETEDTSSKYRRALLTHIEKTKPYVYLQLYPESETIMDRINELIDNVIQEDKHNSSYEIGDHIIAKFTEDDNYYRARIESYSSESELYTVYFLDYGNLDENLPIDNLYSYSNDLNQIEPQARGYLLDKINSKEWNEIFPLVEKNLNDIIEFYFTDENNSIIHLKFNNENEINNIKENIQPIETSTIEQNKTFQANISATDNDCFYIHILPDGNLHVCEIEEILQISNQDRKDTWTINDLCIVSNEENRYYRGEILAINDNKYNVKCIDYGNILENITNDHLYVLPDKDILKQSSLAYKCRLHGIDDVNQVKAIEDVIKTIPTTEHVTITVKNDLNDPCLFVILIRENNEIVNDRYLSDDNDTTNNEDQQESDNDETNEIILPNISDSAISDSENNDEQLTPQTENPNQINTTENQSLLSITNNQTIDFGENDPSTTIKDETNNSISSN